MIDIFCWMERFLDALSGTFEERIWFVGLQGSYGRGEATETSDIDVVVILDALSASDIQRYNTMLDSLPHRERVCGFLSGKNELLRWEPSDLFQFYYDTKPIKGDLNALLPLLDSDAVDRAIKIGVCNIYHGCVHNMLHKKSEKILKGLYKSASFAAESALPTLHHQMHTPGDVSLLATAHSLADTLAEKVPLWEMRCNMDPEAARVSYSAMSRDSKCPL